jgi:hypothetical protein
MDKESKGTTNRLLLYLEGKLAGDERYEVEQTLLRDPLAQVALDGLRESGLSSADLQNDLNDIRQGWQRRPKTTNSRWVAAAAIALLVFTAWAAWGYYQDQQPASLYATYFTRSIENEDYLALRGEEETSVPGLSVALEAYQEQDYQQSLALFQSLREDHPFDGFILRYTAMAAMQVGDYYAAEQALEQCLAIDVPTSDRMAAKWYLALVYLRLDRQEEGQSLLQELAAAGNGMYGSQAQQLLWELTK